MLKNNFNVAIRNLLRHKFYSCINILGLSIGLTCFLYIALFVTDEFSYDLHHPDYERICRMDFTGTINGNEFITALMCAPAAQAMKQDFPEVAESFRFRGTGNWFIKRKDQDLTFKEENVVNADPNFFEFWSVPLLKGDAKTCLERPHTLVMDETTAKKIFGDDDPIGQIVVLDNETDYEVTGVYPDFPRNSHFHFNIMLTMLDHEDANSPMWMSFDFNTYLKLTTDANPAILEAKFPELLRSKLGPEIQKYMNMSFEDFGATGNTASFGLLPLKDIHLHSDKLGELENNGDIKYVYIFSAIGLFILILACINFMNLATARSANRAKEVGVRKVLGAFRTQLIRQFLVEAILICFISTLLAFELAGLLLPYFNELAGKELILSDLISFEFVGIMTGIMLLVGLLSGSYPAFYLSKFKPSETLKGKVSLGMKSGGIRSTLVILQFTVSIVMIVGTAIVYDQLSFIQSKKLGFDKNQVIMVHDAWILGDQAKAYKQEALRDSRMVSGTLASFLPVGTNNNNNVYFPGTAVNGEETYVVINYYVDHDYIRTLGMEIMEGRDFSRDFPTDTAAVIVNESLVKSMGLENPVGSFVSTYAGGFDNPTIASYKIIGVVKDFHYASMKEGIDALLFHLSEESNGFVSFKVNTNELEETVAFLKTLWDEMAPGQPFAYSFLDERFDRIYEAEQKVGKIFGVFAFLAIFIACLGLFGLASFTAEQRRKEIGIRKVLGASVSHIVNKLSFNFIKLVIVSFAIATPIAYYMMKNWLEDFVYRTDIKIWIFLMAGGVSIAIAYLTMGLQSWKAARSNPVSSLRNE